MTDDQTREILEMARDIEAKLDAMAADIAWMNAAMERMTASLEACLAQARETEESRTTAGAAADEVRRLH